MLGIPSPPAHGGSWAVSKSTTVFFWYPFFQMKSFTAFCSVLIRFSSNCGMIWTTWVSFDSASVLTILILPYTVRFLYCHWLNMELTSPSFSKISGLTINQGKTQVLKIGGAANMPDLAPDLGLKWVKELKILGINLMAPC